MKGVQLDKRDITDAIIKNEGCIRHAADKLGCHHTTIYDWMEKDPEIEELVNKERKKADKKRQDNDSVLKKKAYTSIEALIEKGDVTATIFTLKSLCGWSEKQTQDNSTSLKHEKPFEQDNSHPASI